MKKFITNMLLLCVSVLLLSGCVQEKTPITPERFEEIMTEQDFTIVDITDQTGDMARSGLLAVSKDQTYQIEYYQLNSIEIAITSYENNKESLASEDGNGSSSTLSGKNYNSFSQTKNGSYRYISRIEDTLIYVNVDKDLKKDIQGFMKLLGY